MVKITIQKWGNSKGIRIPKNILDSLNLSEGDECTMEVIEHQIVIKKIEKKKKITELFENYEGDYEAKEFDWGDPKGNEIW